MNTVMELSLEELDMVAGGKFSFSSAFNTVKKTVKKIDFNKAIDYIPVLGTTRNATDSICAYGKDRNSIKRWFRMVKDVSLAVIDLTTLGGVTFLKDGIALADYLVESC